MAVPPVHVLRTAHPVVHLIGEIDVSNLRCLSDCLDEFAEATDDVHFDLSRLTFIDARGVAMLVEFADRARPARRVVLHGVPHVFRRILEILWPGGAGVAVVSERQMMPARPTLSMLTVLPAVLPTG